ncbi:DUF4815 domain-containing protein [Geobacter hydrogenophilus]|uniref:Uncharacterized protein n=1 Tax=Geobacter hydrogenophilus TaxID=40983 RepID=A0A9W6FY25_9BACT|nr:DUF6519 domain-containing protein [Geobacter hydrogenophilus]MBT0895068.1 DUF4815 domain-containing protein [Geobacter hydrogenophilus]GLI36893.1 hypothetical protein GHYDROH2_03940 [Geobacter hydrogenophilus]
MKTQISRDSFQPEKRYTGVHQQQGRVITDADWNELVDVCREQLIQALADVVGNGSPRTGAVAITADRKIQPGDLYVDGIRAELPGSAPLLASAQPDLPGYPALPATGPYIVYADVWDRVVTSLEDGTLRDPGLHGADTCTRTQTMLQVKTCPDTVNPETGIPKRGNATLSLSLHTNLEAGDPCDPCAGLIAAGKGRVGSYLFRLEVHAVEGTAANPTRLILKWSSENGAEQYEALAVEKMPPGFVATNYVYEFHNPATEKQLGVFLGTGFTPTHGAIKTTYEIPVAPPKELVRRWDGFCELTKSGSVWSLATGVDKGVTLTTGGLATAPGHVTLGSSIQINLEALQLTLDLSGKTFMAGDFWLAPVREAVLNPGDAVLTSTEPRGIVHHYLLLARVQADGTLIPFNDADKRRHAFPPLTDLHAHDVGYVTTCSSGLFDATHDNVEKALNRLCQLAAEHIAYTADCTKGLYAGFVGTVKQALDKICEIQASHVGFTKPCDTSVYHGSTIATVDDALRLLCNVTAGQIGFAKPCDTSIYQGQTVATVEDALRLLCNVTAGQIAYTPGGACTFLNQPGIDTVQEALDALCARPAGGGCRITVGKDGGVFATLEEALKTHLEQGKRDICLCLLPGDHEFPGQLVSPKVDNVNLCLSGCGHATRLHLLKEPAHFRGFASVCLSDMEVFTHDVPNGAFVFDHCRDVSLKGMAVSGFITEGFLVGAHGAKSVAMHCLELEAASPDSLKMAVELLSAHPALAELYQITDRTAFDQKSVEAAKALSDLSLQDRRTLSGEIGQRVKAATAVLGNRERQSYLDFTILLRQTKVSVADFVAALGAIRIEANRARPAVALSVVDAGADWTLGDCDILGIVTLYGTLPSGPLPADVTKNFDALVKQGKATFAGIGTTFRATGCRVTRIDVSTAVRQRIADIIAGSGGTLTDLFSTAMLGDITLFSQDNQMAFLNTSLSSSVFEAGSVLVAVVMGSTTIYVGNRGAGEAVIINITPQGRSQQAANLGITISG